MTKPLHILTDHILQHLCRNLRGTAPFSLKSKIINESVMVVNFELNGQLFMGLNGGDNFQFNEAVSFVIPCKDQEEIDHYWYKLIADGGKEGNCGWCKDKFGLSWQVVPTILGQLMSNPENGQRVVQAFMKMKKFDIDALQNA